MLTAEQREARRKFIGASDVPAICGLDRYRTVADVWAEKKGLIGDMGTSDAAERGNWLEQSLLAYAAHEIGQAVQPHVMFIDTEGLIAANCDAVTLDGTSGIEAKTSKMSDEWGDDRSNDVPDRVTLQAHAQMHAAGPQMVRVYVPALIAMDLRLYVVDRDESVIAAMLERARAFRQSLAGNTPPAGGMSMEVLKAVRRIPGKVSKVDAEIVRQWRLCKDLLNEAEKREEELKAKVIQQLGDAEGGEVVEADGNQVATLTYFKASREGIDLKKLRAEYPEAAAACLKVSNYWTLRHKQLKGLVTQ